MQLVLLAGGLGTRLADRLDGLPKFLAPVGDKAFASRLLDSLRNKGISSLHFCLGYGSEKILNFLNETSIDCDWTVSTEKHGHLAGTLGALRLATKHLDDTFLVQYGDSILDVSYVDVLNSHISSGKQMTMTYTDVFSDDANIYEEIKKGKSVLKYDKRRDGSVASYVDYGLICMDKPLLLIDCEPDREGLVGLDRLQRDLSESENINFIYTDKRYREIGTPETYTQFVLEEAK